MATLNESSLQMRLEKRKGTISEVDRPLFEKQQTECITKAIKNEECPAKEKHVRRAIIGTWQERGNSMFWMVIGRQPLPSQAILCWKALTVMLKILREGHPNVLKDSYIYRKTLKDLLASYKFQAGLYSTLIVEYLKVLQIKVDLHHKYPGLPGSLTFTAENPVKIPGRDINDVFTFALESLDYQDLLLSLEENTLQTLDKSKNNSNIASSQCKIAPLVPILKECSGMYDVLIQVLTKLHKNLPPDTLDGLRQRFYNQHKKLKTFCMHAGSLTYITSLTSIPSIPEDPPDFLIHKYHEKKTKREEPKEEPKLPEPIAQQVDERDILIEQLMLEISELREHLEVTISQSKAMEDHLRMEILRQKEEVKRMEEIARQVHQENNFLKEQLEVSKEDNVEDKMKTADEKFNKLKGLYGKLRQDHIDLLRKNAEIKQKEETLVKLTNELEEKLDKCKLDLAEKEKGLSNLEKMIGQLNLNNQKLKVDFVQTEEVSNSQVQNLKDQLTLQTDKLEGYENKINNLESELMTTKENANKQIKSLTDQLNNMMSEKTTEELARKSAEDTIIHLRSDKEDLQKRLEISLIETKKLFEKENLSREQADGMLSQLTTEMDIKSQGDAVRMKIEMLSSTATECEKIIKDALELFNDPKHESGTTCSADFLLSRLEDLPVSVKNTTTAYSLFYDTKHDVFPLISLLHSTCHTMGNALIHGKATSHMSSPEDCQNLVSACRNIGDTALTYIGDFKNMQDSIIIREHGSCVEKEIENLMKFVEELIPKQADADNVENIVDEEMHATEKLVEEAAARIEEILNKARHDHSGVELEVNEKILETCTALMKAIRELILRSKDLQDEIVADGRGTASVTEYYKRHHKWAEGLLSAAKSVGWGATVLVDAADKVIERKGKFEELIVASHEITASTAQLVAASRVKAKKNSPKLPPLMTASKKVGEATAGVVAAVRSGSSLTEESKSVPDYSKMTLTQAKRWEMDSQVKILQFEDLLQKERLKLGQLRKAHYQIAAELYGEENVNFD